VEYSSEQLRPIWIDPELATALDRMMDRHPEHETYDSALKHIIRDWLRMNGHLSDGEYK
jgi:hypothetical protein